MVSSKLLIATLVLLSTLLEIQSQGIQSFTKKWNFVEKEIILSRDETALEINSSGENRFLYALCEEGHWKPKKICDVIVESYTMENLTYKSTCKLNLTTGNENRMIGRNFIVTHLGVEKAIFMWLDRERANWADHKILLGIRLIEWSSCDFTDIKIPIDMQSELIDEISFNNVVVYESTFDVFFHSKTLCETGRCKVTYDAKGKRIGAVQSFLPKQEISPMALVFPVGTSSSKGYYAFNWILGQFSAFLVNTDGETKDLMNVHYDGYITFAISNKCETFGVCWVPMRGDTTVRCSQIDSHARSKLNLTLNFGYKIVYVRMHNLADGGFLLLQLVCTNKDCVGYKTFYLSRIYPDGHHDNRPLEIDGIDMDIPILDRYRINLFERSGDEFCMTVVGPATLNEFDVIEHQPKLTYVSKCFHKKYASVK